MQMRPAQPRINDVTPCRVEVWAPAIAGDASIVIFQFYMPVPTENFIRHGLRARMGYCDAG
jgi:hypothetical protein